MGITRKTVYLLLIGVPVVVLGALLGAPWAAFWSYNAAVITLFITDARRAPRKRELNARRSWEGSFELRRQGEVTLTVESAASREQHLRICDTQPESFVWTREPLTADCTPGATARAAYTVQPTERGSFRFGGCHVEVAGPMGLCVRRYVLPCGPEEAPVYPDLEPMRKYRLLTSRRQLNRDDQSIHRVRGVGSEFVGIREYSLDDDTRKINWMATARADKLMTNQYDVERNQQVLLALDLGRWMDAPLGPVTRLDRAAELCAALAQTAISSGDRVGLILYDTKVRAWLKPAKGQGQMHKVLDLLYKAHSGRHESNLDGLAAYVSRRMRHRGFVCVFSYLDGPEAAEQAGRSLWALGRRHAVLLSSLSNPVLDELSAARAQNLPELYLKASAIYSASAEHDAARRLRRYGSRCLSAEPTHLLSLIVRQYTRFKQFATNG